MHVYDIYIFERTAELCIRTKRNKRLLNVAAIVICRNKPNIDVITGKAIDKLPFHCCHPSSRIKAWANHQDTRSGINAHYSSPSQGNSSMLPSSRSNSYGWNLSKPEPDVKVISPKIGFPLTI